MWNNRIMLFIFFMKIKKPVLPRKLKRLGVNVGVR